MGRALRWIGLGFLTLTAAGVDPSVSNARFMFPALVLLRESSGRTVTLSHAGADPSTGNISRDTIAMLYSRLTPTTVRSEEQLKGRRFIEVAEFFGPQWAWYSSGQGQMPAFENANHFSRIYVPANGEPAIWDNPVVAPGGVSTRFYRLDTVAVGILASRGFKVRDADQRGPLFQNEFP